MHTTRAGYALDTFQVVSTTGQAVSQAEYRSLIALVENQAAQALAAAHNEGQIRIPTLLFPDGTVLAEPTLQEVARQAGLGDAGCGQGGGGVADALCPEVVAVVVGAVHHREAGLFRLRQQGNVHHERHRYHWCEQRHGDAEHEQRHRRGGVL